MKINKTINDFKTTKIFLKCPFCERGKTSTVCDAVPRNRVDCSSCGATAMVRLMREIVKDGHSKAKVWDVEWEAA